MPERQTGITVSIITPHYNSPDRLRALCNSMERQTVSLDQFEWIVVDDGSTTGDLDWIREYSGTLKIRFLHSEENRGRAATRNSGIREAEAPIIAFIDADMVVSPVWLESMVRGVQETESVVVGRMKPHPSLPRSAFNRYYHSRGAAKLTPGTEIPGKYFTAANAALPSDLLKRHGGFDESLRHWGGEDLELGLRLQSRGVRFYSQPGALAWHDHRVCWKEMDARYRRYGNCVVPELLVRYPEAKEALSLHLLDPPENEVDIKHFMLHYAVVSSVHPKMYKTLGRLVRMFPRFPWPDKVFDYLVFSSYSENYRNSQGGFNA